MDFRPTLSRNNQYHDLRVLVKSLTPIETRCVFRPKVLRARFPLPASAARTLQRRKDGRALRHGNSSLYALFKHGSVALFVSVDQAWITRRRTHNSTSAGVVLHGWRTSCASRSAFSKWLVRPDVCLVDRRRTAAMVGGAASKGGKCILNIGANGTEDARTDAAPAARFHCIALRSTEASP